MHRKLLLFSGAFALAAVFFCILGVGTIWYALAAAVCAAALLASSKRYRPIAILLLGFAVGMAWCIGYTAVLEQKLNSVPLGTKTVSAQIVQCPERTRYGSRVRVKFRPSGICAMLYLPDGAQVLAPGDEISCTATVRRTASDEDSFVFNAARGVWITASAKSDLTVRHTDGFSLPLFPARLSFYAQKLVNDAFPEKTGDFFKALLTGNRSELPPQTEEDLQLAGIYHVVAVSGMHISTLVGALFLLFRRKRRLTAVFGIPVILLFVLMSGASPSAARAGVMQGLFLASFLLRRENDPATSLGAAGLVLLLSNPWAILSASLQLSFAAVAGILLFADRIVLPVRKSRFAARFLQIAPLRWLFDTLLASFACSVSATALTLPLTVLYFGFYSVLTPISNTLLLWAVIPCYTLGLAALLLSLLYLPLGAIAAKAAELLADYVLSVSAQLAKIPFAAASFDDAYFAVWLVFFYIMLLLLLCIRKMPKLMPVLCMLTLYGACILLSSAEARSADFSFTALNVGQGQCLMLNEGECTAVIDCGGTNDVSAARKATEQLMKLGADDIDALILTHFDRDHIGGAAYLLERHRVKTLYIPDTDGAEENGNLARILALCRENGAEIREIKTMDSARLGDIRLQIFDANASDHSANSGICVLASYGEYDILVTGDLSRKEESDMLLRYEIPQTELLVAGHHGSEDACGWGVLQTTRPETVIISVGENDYGQPSEATIDRIRSFGAEIYRTDQCGSITVRR